MSTATISVLSRTLALVAALAVFPLLPISAFAASPPSGELLPVETWGTLPAVDDVAISPNGKVIAFARNESDGRQVVALVDVDSQSILRAVAVRSSKRESEQSRVRDIAFATDDHLTYLLHATFSTARGIPDEAIARGRSRIDYLRTGIIDVASGQSRLVSLDERKDWGISFTGMVAPIAGRPGIGRMVIHSSPYTDRILSVYDVNLVNGRLKRSLPGLSNTEGFAFDEQGEAVARLDINHLSNTWTLHAIDGRKTSVIKTAQSETGWSGFAGMLGRSQFVFLNDDLPDRPRQVIYSLEAGATEPKVLLEHPDHDVSETIDDPWRNSVVGGVIIESLPEQHFIDAELAGVQQTLRKRMPGATLRFNGWSMDRKRFIVHIETAADPGGFFLYEPAGRRLSRLTTSYPKLAGPAVGDRLEISYPARDGSRIPAYLTRPAGHEKGALPTVLLVHGGPVSRDTLGFDWWASFLASRGYLVVQPNYRGSAGYGRAFREAGYKSWGRLMQDDVEDAVHALVKAGFIDPQRICIAGASYGGYATLVGLTRTPDLFRCAVSVAGVADLPRMLELTAMSSGRHHAVTDWWNLLIGDRQRDRAAIEAVSPAHQADHAKAPVLLIHGANDTIVPIEHSERMEAALRKAGKSVEFVRFDGEDHWLSDAKTRIAMLQEMERFLAEHIGGADSRS